MSHKYVFFCRFEFLQACSGKLAEPNLPPGHTWSGEKVQRLAGQGHIYIRPTYPFSAQPPEVRFTNPCMSIDPAVGVLQVNTSA